MYFPGCCSKAWQHIRPATRNPPHRQSNARIDVAVSWSEQSQNPPSPPRCCPFFQVLGLAAPRKEGHALPLAGDAPPPTNIPAERRRVAAGASPVQSSVVYSSSVQSSLVLQLSATSERWQGLDGDKAVWPPMSRAHARIPSASGTRLTTQRYRIVAAIQWLVAKRCGMR